MNIKKKLQQEVWQSDNYLLLSKKASMDIDNIGMKILKRNSLKARKLLDLGCGEGTRLNWLLSKGQIGIGVDLSSKAIDRGRKNYPKIKFIQADLEQVPLESNDFDLVYSAYVLEHLTDPAKVLREAIRLTSQGGNLILLAPNYGAPNRASPPFKGSRINKLIKGFVDDLLNLNDYQKINWRRVTPISSKVHHEMDWDTAVEPYLGSLLNYIRLRGLKIEYYSSCWEEELPKVKFHQKIFKYLSKLQIYPFTLWGPHLVVVARKVS